MSEVFSVIPVTALAFSINSPSKFNVVLICISMHHSCILVNSGAERAIWPRKS
jgi:hypothetical protein